VPTKSVRQFFNCLAEQNKLKLEEKVERWQFDFIEKESVLEKHVAV